MSMPFSFASSVSRRVIPPTHKTVEFVTGIAAKYSSILASRLKRDAMARAAANQPRISVNKLAEFIDAKAARQRQILRDQKFPSDFKGMYYKEAAETIALCIESNLENTAIIERTIQTLEQQTTDKIGTQRRIQSNIDALETFESMLDDIDLKGAKPSLGDHAPPRLTIQNVEISVRPEIILTGNGKKKQPLVGALKLHFPRTFPLDDSAQYVSALLQEFAKTYLSNDGETHGPFCPVIDIGSKQMFAGVKSIRARMREIEAACRNIFGLWPTITPED